MPLYTVAQISEVTGWSIDSVRRGLKGVGALAGDLSGKKLQKREQGSVQFFLIELDENDIKALAERRQISGRGAPMRSHADSRVAAPSIVEEDALGSRERQRLTDELGRTRKALRDAERELNGEDDIRSSVFRLSDAPLIPPKWNPRQSSSADKGQNVPVLFTSDFQWGEVVSPEEVDFLNKYDSEVAAERYQVLIDKTIDIANHHIANPDYPGIFYLRGGDTISGDIHGELRETNDLSSLPAAIDVAQHEIAGIEKLADAFGRVFVVSVPGNHGRQTVKPVAKKYADTNYDTLISYMIERHFVTRNDERISFYTPKSGDAFFDIAGHKVFLTHGDRMGSRGGQGFIGPAATIMRGHKKIYDEQTKIGRNPDIILTGHLHTPLELTFGFANGSLAGFNEYARTIRAIPEAPSQWLLFMHPQYGVTSRWKVYVENPRLVGLCSHGMQ